MCARLLVLGMVAVLAAARPTTAQTVLFVNGGQTTGANTGVSWGDAFRGEGALQRALEAAGSPPLGGPMVEVWVAQGTYVPSARTDPAQPLSVTFRLRSRVQLYGGFVGTETSRPERDPWGNPTVLSGLVAPEERAWHVVTTGGVDASCVLDGFVVRDGRAESHEPGIRSRGGGIYNVGGSPIVRNCAIVDNFAAYAQGLDREGGGVYTSDGSPRFVACEFRRNYGGLGAGLSGDATLIDCLFEGNISSGLDGWGGAAYGHLVARRCAFRDNFSKFAGGALLGSGTVEDCVFEGNDSDHSHSAMYGTFTVLRSEFRNNWGFGGPSVEGDSFTDCTFVSNTAGYSAGVDGRVFARCRFEEHRGTFGVRVRERRRTACSCGTIDRSSAMARP